MSREEAITEMKQYFDEKAEVGLFWYHPVLEELFEVYSMPAILLKEKQFTYPKLHKTIWQKLHHSAINREQKGLPYDPIYLMDYTQVPRGRVFFINEIFYVFVGEWITNDIKKMIIKQFNLKNSQVVFKTDIHWNLGHGWSTEEGHLDLDLDSI
jgi:hypothetical protein